MLAVNRWQVRRPALQLALRPALQLALRPALRRTLQLALQLLQPPPACQLKPPAVQTSPR